MAKHKRLTLQERIEIQQGLDSGESFRQIGEKLGKDPTTIAKEVRNHFLVEEKGLSALFLIRVRIVKAASLTTCVLSVLVLLLHPERNARSVGASRVTVPVLNLKRNAVPSSIKHLMSVIHARPEINARFESIHTKLSRRKKKLIPFEVSPDGVSC